MWITFFKVNTISGRGNYIINDFFPFNSSYFTSETKIHSYIQENILFLLDTLNHIQWTDYGRTDYCEGTEDEKETLTFISLLGLLKARASDMKSHIWPQNINANQKSPQKMLQHGLAPFSKHLFRNYQQAPENLRSW